MYNIIVRRVYNNFDCEFYTMSFFFFFVRAQVQDNVSDMQLRHERHILVPTRSGLVLVQDTERGQCQAQGPDIR